MLKNPNFEQNYWSRTSTGIYKIGHDSIRLMEWICYYDKSYYENKNYYDLMASICKYNYSYTNNFIQMKYLNGQYYTEVKDHRYRIHPNGELILRKRDPPKSLTAQYQVKNETKIRTNQKVIRNDDNQLVVKNYQQQKFKPPNCPTCKQNSWLEFDKGYYCRNCEYIINKQKHQIDKKSY